MIALGKPYVSPFLLDTLVQNSYPVIATPEALELMGSEDLNWITEAEARAILRQPSGTKVYTNSENTIGWLEQNAKSSPLPAKIRAFKNKIRFREMLAGFYPEYYFQGLAYQELSILDVGSLEFPLILKPSVGFFSVAVHRIENAGEWKEVLGQIEAELEAWRGTYPTEVIDTSEFILEACIEGEEYAIDCYYDPEGKPVILNILHHLFSSGKDVSDRVYTTSENIIYGQQGRIQNFLERLGSKTKLRNFPLHLELRIDLDGKVWPIEGNPLRFGGWCTTADLTWFAYGINSYEYFFSSSKPDWEKVFRTRKNKKFSVVVLDNNSGIHESQIESFDFVKLGRDFERVLEMREVDFRTYSVFGFLFVESSEGHDESLMHILTSNLKPYINLKSPTEK